MVYNVDVGEDEFLNKLIKQLPEYGIDTSTWEYDYGDCCYGGMIEFIARCIKGYSTKQKSNDVGDVEKYAEIPHTLEKFLTMVKNSSPEIKKLIKDEIDKI